MNTFGDNLRKFRKARKLTQQAFGKAVGVSGPTVSDWENEVQSPRGSNLISLLSKFPEVSEFIPKSQSLFEPTKNVEAAYIGHVDSWDSETELDEDEVEVPFFMDVELAAGVGSELVYEYPGYKLRFSKSTLKKCGVDARAAACVKVFGNSMEPRLYDGDVVGVNTADKRIVDGKVYAINHDGLMRIKRLYRLPGNGIRINSFNKEEYPDEELSPDDRVSFHVIGRVFWHSSIWD